MENGKEKHHRSSKRKAARVIVYLLLVAFAALIVFAAVALIKLLGMHETELGPQETLLYTPRPNTTPGSDPSGDDPNTPEDTGIYNYLLLGSDTRALKTEAIERTDVMMILTLDMEHKKLKLTSLMRDIVVSTSSDGSKHKLNGVCRSRGTDGLMNVVYEKFGVRIDGWGLVNFEGIATIIEKLGGVDVDISSDEKEQMNLAIKNYNKVAAKKSEYVEETGEVHLNGAQSLAYMRIRHVGRGDYDRTGRQREIMSVLFDSIRGKSALQLADIALTLTDYCVTNLTLGDLTDIAGRLAALKNASVEELRVPIDDSYYGEISLVVNFDKNKKAIDEFIYETEPNE